MSNFNWFATSKSIFVYSFRVWSRLVKPMCFLQARGLYSIYSKLKKQFWKALANSSKKLCVTPFYLFVFIEIWPNPLYRHYHDWSLWCSRENRWTIHLYTVRKKSWKIEISMNIYSWGGVKPRCRWNFNDIWVLLHPMSKYLLNFQFSPIFF